MIMPQVSFYNIYFHLKKKIKQKQNLQRSLAVLNFFLFSLLFPLLRYLIPNAGDATKVIKQQIMKVLDALESS